jgi:hypothetical protein
MCTYILVVAVVACLVARRLDGGSLGGPPLLFNKSMDLGERVRIDIVGSPAFFVALNCL